MFQARFEIWIRVPGKAGFPIKKKQYKDENNKAEAEFKEFKPRLKYGWFHLKLYSIFQDLSRRSMETGFWGIWDGA